MRKDIRKIVELLKVGIDRALLSADIDEYLEAMDEIAVHCEGLAESKRDKLREGS